jgi:hypothetical protein
MKVKARALLHISGSKMSEGKLELPVRCGHHAEYAQMSAARDLIGECEGPVLDSRHSLATVLTCIARAENGIGERAGGPGPLDRLGEINAGERCNRANHH